MKLDWKRAGRASISAVGNNTLVVQQWDDGRFGWHLVGQGSAHYGSGFSDLASAELACEAHAEELDKPEWHDATDWLSWAEWRGLKILVRPETACSIGTYYAQATEANGMTRSAPNMTCTTVKSAKAAAEKWIREQGERA